VSAHPFRPLAALALVASVASTVLAQDPARDPAAAPYDVAWVKANYRKVEMRIPMRDGVRLFTSIYVPRDTAGKRFPILMTRTPYSAQPYGDTLYRATLGPSGNPRWAREGYIFVVQDVRGRWYSEGEFTEMTPHKPVKKDPKQDVDESTDSYDTVDWLIKNVRPNNGAVGIFGGSWPGFYATASCIDAHPALKACSPQAPMTDVAAGDDNYHNGAFLLAHNFGFFTRFGRGPRLKPGPDAPFQFSMGTRDAYKFYLEMGPVGPGSRKYSPPDEAPLWNTIIGHPTYDDHWEARNIRKHLKGMRPGILVVGGFFDTEDLAGPWSTWRAIEQLTPQNDARIIVGPWSHGGWGRGDANVLGDQRFGAPSGPFFRDSIEVPFFRHHLRGTPLPAYFAEAMVFETGTNRWRFYESFPTKEARKASLYLHPGGKLAFTPPPALSGAAEFDAYVSDPSKPVPTTGRIETNGMPRDYITGDQRYASRRSDVLTYQSDVLTEDVTIAGPLSPLLHVATSGTDADFFVKVIDVMPDDAPNWEGDASGFTVGGAQFLLRGEPFRGRYRRSFRTPVPFVPDQPDSLAFTMPDINHTFRRGHRIMIQIQSSWFPFIDRNPQTFVPNIFEALPGDFRAATMRVYRSAARPTRVEVLVQP
jgi:putative CocE/NonD family hydrolase